ncbi:thiamine biosynthesis protein ThiF [Sulfurimonas sp.]|uniref:thiamine biosynthesis protein ThiF n=1 Tax=Sulfurimonas sp. TaxID=2022749 RepID=UPI002AB1DC68|nr:thiamine biosynthesis protein ThiF [Sulfurimonas sp.]
MMAGFKLFCMGIIGDGCGGGREFIVQNGVLTAYDPQSEESRILLQGIKKPISISKKACIVIIKCEDEVIEFDLSLMSRV